MHTGEGWRLEHRPALDGLRAVAFLLVFCAHSKLLPNAAGYPGVAVFFALSGFLITALLLEEHTRTGGIRFRGFYERRVRRLLPALFALLAAVALLWSAVGMTAPTGHILGTLFFVSNWQQIHEGVTGGPLAHMWTLAVEEQFYLVWPVVIAVAARRGRSVVIGVCVAGIVAAVTWRAWLWADGASELRIGYGSDARADSLLLGALVAAMLVGRVGVRIRESSLPAVLLAGVLAFAIFGSVPPPVMSFMVPAATALLVWQIVTGVPMKVLEWRPLAWLGRRSYGLYLWHLPVLGFGYPVVGVGGWRSLLLLAVTVGVAAASWRYVEEPFLRRRSVRAGEAAGLLGGAARVAAPTAGAEPVTARVESARG